MEKVSVFKTKNKWGKTIACVVACVILAPALGAVLFLPQVLSLLPVLLLAMAGYVGPVSAAACSLVLVGVGSTLFGVWGGVCAALLIVPAVMASMIALEREQPFWLSVMAGGVTMFASMFIVIAMLTMIAGSDVVTALSGIMRQVFDMSGGFGDALLSVLMQMGVITAPEGATISGGVLTLDPALREELISGIILMTDSVMRLEIPMQMATGAVAAGLLGQAALRKGLLARGVKVEYPRLSSWRVPKGWGRILGGTLAVLYLLAMLVPSSMNTMFYVFSGVFDQVFALQGIASVCYLLEKHGKSRRMKRLIFLLGYFLLRTPAMIAGLADQAIDFTHRREELEKSENPFDPRRGE